MDKIKRFVIQNKGASSLVVLVLLYIFVFLNPLVKEGRFEALCTAHVIATGFYVYCVMHTKDEQQSLFDKIASKICMGPLYLFILIIMGIGRLYEIVTGRSIE